MILILRERSGRFVEIMLTSLEEGGQVREIKKGGKITVSRIIELYEDKEEVEGVLLRYKGNKVSIMPVVYPMGQLVTHHSVISYLLVLL